MAVVYRARDLRHRREVALKILQGEGSASVAAERFLREIETVASLAHPHILPVYDSGNDDGILWYAMPIADGESLRARLSRERQLPLDEVLRIAQQVADALGYAHTHQVLHRDVKPDNILLHNGHAMVADFGIARAFEETADSRLTQSGTVIGTPEYMSPEQAAGDARLDARSDLYSLACVVYEMLGGEPPHTGPTPQAILARQLRGEVRSLRPLRPSVSPALDAVVGRALSPAPADRFRSVSEFAAALTTTSHETGTSIEGRDVDSGAWLSNKRRTSSRRRVWLTAGALLMALVAVVMKTFAGARSDGRVGLAVFPFRATNAISEQWSERVADYVVTTIDGTPGVRVADPWALWRTLRPARDAQAGSPDPAEAARLSADAGAEHFVLGSIVLLNDRLDVTVRVYRTRREEPLITFMDSAPKDSLAVLVQRVAVGVIRQLGIDDRVMTERRTTSSIEAFKSYLAAREALRRGMLDSADNSVQRAITLDSNFALAWVAAVGIRSWRQYANGQSFAGLIPMAERAVALSDSLSERERLRARAMLASVRTDGPGMAEALGRIIQIDSTDLDAWELLSYSHFVYGWQYGVTEEETMAATERLLRLDPGSFSGLLRRSQLAAGSGDSVDVRLQLERLRRADTTIALVKSALWYLRAMAANEQEFDSMLGPLGVSDATQWISALRGLRWSNPARADRLIVRIGEVAGPGAPAQAVVQARVGQQMAEGRLHELDSVRRSGGLKSVPTMELRVDLALVASSVAGLRDSAAESRALSALTALVPVDSAREYLATRPVWWAGWALGAYHAALGDSAIARAWQAALLSLPPGGTSRDYRAALKADIEARLAWRRGDTTAALTAARSAYDLWSIHSSSEIDAQPEPAIRFMLASLLRAVGQPDSAAAIYRSMVPPGSWTGFYTPRAWLELGELAEQQGDAVHARRFYALAAEIWRSGDPAVMRWREVAEAGWERVTGTPRSSRLRPMH